MHEHSDDEDIFVMSHEAAAHKYSDSTKIEVKSFLTMVQSAHELGVAPEPLGIVSKTREDRGVINVGATAWETREPSCWHPGLPLSQASSSCRSEKTGLRAWVPALFFPLCSRTRCKHST